MVFSCHDIDQVTTMYGDQVQANTFLSKFSNRAYLRVPDGNTNEWIVRELGMQEVIETQVSASSTEVVVVNRFGRLGLQGVQHFDRNSYASKGESSSFVSVPLILPGELKRLKDCEAIYDTTLGITRVILERTALKNLLPAGAAKEENVVRFANEDFW